MKFRTLLTLALLLVLTTPIFAQEVPVGPPIPYTHKVMLTFVPLDAKGNMTSVYSAPVWGVNDANLGTVTVVPSTTAGELPMTAWFEPKGAPGDVVITATADADAGTTVRNVTATIKLSIVGDATSAVIGVGVPVKR